jgi:hypothetical protein
MRKSLSVLLLAGLAGGLAMFGWAVPASGQAQTFRGTLVDLYCYTQNKENSGMHHGNQRECAWACVKYTAMPVGLLTSEGRSFELIGGVVANNNAKIAPHIGKTVTVTGTVGVRDGMPTITTNEVTVVK